MLEMIKKIQEAEDYASLGAASNEQIADAENELKLKFSELLKNPFPVRVNNTHIIGLGTAKLKNFTEEMQPTGGNVLRCLVVLRIFVILIMRVLHQLLPQIMAMV